MEYHGIYKCRLCGKEYEDCATGNKDIVLKIMIELSIFGKTNELQSPTLISTHNCQDGSMGTSDFQGFKTMR